MVNGTSEVGSDHGRARAAGAHAAYLGELQSGALLGEGDAELQRELSLLLRTLLLLAPPLRRLHLLVRLLPYYASRVSLFPLASHCCCTCCCCWCRPCAACTFWCVHWPCLPDPRPYPMSASNGVLPYL